MRIAALNWAILQIVCGLFLSVAMFETEVIAAETLSPGSGSFQFTDRLGNVDRPITVWTCVPQKLRFTSPIVFVMHGMARNGEDYRDQWIEHAEQRGFLLVVPEFAEKSYSDDAYQRGNMFDRSGRPIPKERWTFTTIEHLFDKVKAMSGNTSQGYYIYGHSAGGQFVQRLVLFLPQARYRRAIAANPGWYTMPDLNKTFPFGLQKSTANEATLKESFENSFVLLLGDKDVNRDDPNLYKSPEADQQGPNRFARGKAYFQTAKQRAGELGAAFNWKQQTVRGAGHSDRQMSKAAAAALFAR
jgi:pimeloyl-ACP methyl ester carboxylesterase